MAGCTTPAVRPCVDVAFTTHVLRTPDGPADAANLRLADVDSDGRLDVLVAQPMHSLVTVLTGCPQACLARDLAFGLTAPVRTAVADMDGDHLADLVVADIGVLFPADTDQGRIVILHALPNGSYEPAPVLDHVGRSVCAEPGDLDGDGDLDLTVCVFGHMRTGSFGWLEQTAPLRFLYHVLAEQPGHIVSYPVDVDGDGDLDLLDSVAQQTEQVQLWRNNGRGHFEVEVLAAGGVTYYGMSGLWPADLDGDGDVDIVAAHGDVFDNDLPSFEHVDSFYGVFWLENDGRGHFSRHDLGGDWGAYGLATTDVDRDGDTDIVVSNFQFQGGEVANRTVSLTWLENDGHRHFTRHDVPGAPQNLITAAAGDLDGDGRNELLVGSHYPDGSSGPSLVAYEQATVAPAPGCAA